MLGGIWHIFLVITPLMISLPWLNMNRHYIIDTVVQIQREAASDMESTLYLAQSGMEMTATSYFNGLFTS
jgi:hypothetical protein